MQLRNLLPHARDRNVQVLGVETPERCDWARIACFGCLCIAIFDGAHLVYRASRAPAWFDVQSQLANHRESGPSRASADDKILAPGENDLDC